MPETLAPDPVAPEPRPEPFPTFEEPTSIPAAVRPPAREMREPERRLPWGVFAGAALVALVLGGLVFLFAGHDRVMQIWPGTEQFYRNIGLHEGEPGEGLEFANVASREERGASGGTVLIVEGDIRNHTGTAIGVPRLVASITGPQGEVLQSWVFEAEAAVVPGDGEIAFASRIADPVPGGVSLALGFEGAR